MRYLEIQTEDLRETRWFMQRVTTGVNALSLTMRFWMSVLSTVIFPGLAALVKNHGLWLLLTLIFCATIYILQLNTLCDPLLFITRHIGQHPSMARESTKVLPLRCLSATHYLLFD